MRRLVGACIGIQPLRGFRTPRMGPRGAEKWSGAAAFAAVAANGGKQCASQLLLPSTFGEATQGNSEHQSFLTQ